MDNYQYWVALDRPEPPWIGPFRSQAAAVRAGQRGDGRGRVLYVRSGIVLGPGSWMQLGIERVDP